MNYFFLELGGYVCKAQAIREAAVGRSLKQSEEQRRTLVPDPAAGVQTSLRNRPKVLMCVCV